VGRAFGAPTRMARKSSCTTPGISGGQRGAARGSGEFLSRSNWMVMMVASGKRLHKLWKITMFNG